MAGGAGRGLDIGRAVKLRPAENFARPLPCFPSLLVALMADGGWLSGAYFAQPGAKLPAWRTEPGLAEHNGSASSAFWRMRRGQPVGALATSSDGGGIVADPLTNVPCRCLSSPASFASAPVPSGDFAPAVMFPQVRPYERAGYTLDASSVSSRAAFCLGDALRVGSDRPLDGDRCAVPCQRVALPDALPRLIAGVRSSSAGGISAGCVCAMGDRSTARGEASSCAIGAPAVVLEATRKCLT